LVLCDGDLFLAFPDEHATLAKSGPYGTSSVTYSSPILSINKCAGNVVGTGMGGSVDHWLPPYKI
jgi:hypothetical protein